MLLSGTKILLKALNMGLHEEMKEKAAPNYSQSVRTNELLKELIENSNKQQEITIILINRLCELNEDSDGESLIKKL